MSAALGNRVTVSRNGASVGGYIWPEVVLGEVPRNIDASERINISNEGSLIGDVTA